MEDPEYIGGSFSWALQRLKDGNRVCRGGWNGKDMWLVLVPGSEKVTFTEGSPYQKAGLESGDINPHIDMFTAQGTMQPGWLASQTDLLAMDWQVLPVEEAKAA
jgi:hypothetical protein